MQVRGLAVCAAWRRYLDVRAWPLEHLEVDVGCARPLAKWVFLRQPATRSFALAVGRYGSASRATEQLASSALLSLTSREVRRAEGW